MSRYTTYMPNAHQTGAVYRVRAEGVSFGSCYAIARFSLIFFINIEDKNTNIKLNISVTDIDNKLVQP